MKSKSTATFLCQLFLVILLAIKSSNSLPFFCASISKQQRFNDAIDQQNWPLVQKLLGRTGVDPSARNDLALNIAILFNQTAIFRHLIADYRVDGSANNNAAIQYAVVNQDFASVDRLLRDARVDPSANHNFPIRHACESGNVQIVRRLLRDPRVDPAVDDNYPLRISVMMQHEEILQDLLQTGRRVDPGALDSWSLQHAVQERFVGIACILISDPRVNPSANNNFALRKSCENGDIEIVKRLLRDQRVDPNVDQQYPLRIAELRGDQEMVNILNAAILRRSLRNPVSLVQNALPIQQALSNIWQIGGRLLRPGAPRQPPPPPLSVDTTNKKQKVFVETECPVCFESFQEAQPVLFGGCGHLICERCASQLTSCPLCRHN